MNPADEKTSPGVPPPPYDPSTSQPVGFAQAHGYGYNQPGDHGQRSYGQVASHDPSSSQPVGYAQAHGYGYNQPGDHGQPPYGQVPPGKVSAYGHGAPTNRTVVISQPGQTVIAPIVRPPDYLVLSIVSCFFCWPMAICALVSSSNSRGASDRGDLVEAESSGKTARNVAIAAIVLGSVLCIVFVILRVAVYSETTYTYGCGEYENC